jgi:hypothetical protein
MPFLMPFPMMQGNPSREEAPARVRTALEFLQHLTFKTMDRAAVTDIKVEVVEGQKLTEDEVDSHKRACELLGDYFSGTLKPDMWEKLLSQRSDSPPPGVKGRVIMCFACAPQPPNPSCVFCRGQGNLLIYPVGNGHGGGE